MSSNRSHLLNVPTLLDVSGSRHRCWQAAGITADANAYWSHLNAELPGDCTKGNPHQRFKILKGHISYEHLGCPSPIDWGRRNKWECVGCPTVLSRSVFFHTRMGSATNFNWMTVSVVSHPRSILVSPLHVPNSSTRAPCDDILPTSQRWTFFSWFSKISRVSMASTLFKVDG